MGNMYLDLFYGLSQEELEEQHKKAERYYDQEQPAGRKIKRSECPYGGIDCAWCMEDCE